MTIWIRWDPKSDYIIYGWSLGAKCVQKAQVFYSQMSCVAAFGFNISKTDMHKVQIFQPEDFDYNLLQNGVLLTL